MTETVHTNPEEWLGRFGLSAFRPGQSEVIATVLAGRDCLCIMPTGGGKSLCYQLPAVMRPGVVLVISPLIALMKDQVDALQTLGLRATFINSSLDGFEQRQRMQGMAAGEFDLVYVAPERLRSSRFLEALNTAKVQLLAIDEAHCISEWGHDFRPDYARIGRFREKLGLPQTIALTATATPLVRADVVKQLQLQTPDVFVTGFARPNLRFEVDEPASNADKDSRLLSLLDDTPGPALIYASTRKKCEAVAEFLSKNRREAVGLYHAGLMPDDRRAIQDRFMSGEVSVIVATNAFGMGIDKRDLRLVVHYNIPGSLEAYYQEAGRAGRDGELSRCVLLFSYSDRYVQEFFIDNRYPTSDCVRRVFEFLRLRPEDPVELTLQEIKDQLGLSLSNEGVGVCEQLLEKCGVLERLDSQQNMAQVKLDSRLPTLVDLLPREAKVQRKVLRELEQEVDDRRGEWVAFYPHKIAAAAELDREALVRAVRELTKLSVFHYVPPFRGRAIHFLRRDLKFEQLNIDFPELERRKAAELQKLERVISYAQSRRCRQGEILHYFGDSHAFRCEICDNCRPVGATQTKTSPSVSAEHDEAVLHCVKIVLSGAARGKGRIGKSLLAKMLCGSESAQISQLRLDKLSTFGLLQGFRQSDVVDFIKCLIRAALLTQSEPQSRRPVIQLTELGGQVMRGQTGLPAAFSLPADLLAKLRRRFSHLGRNAGQKPVETPADKSTPAAVRMDAGSSESTVESAHRSSMPDAVMVPRNDEPVDSLIRAADVNDELTTERAPLGTETDERPNYYWTWRLLADGYSVADCLKIRRIDHATLLNHLIRASHDGRAVQLDWVFNPEQHQLLTQAFEQLPPSRFIEILEDPPAGLQAPHIQLFCQVRAARGQ